jgi:hypothetical protein
MIKRDPPRLPLALLKWLAPDSDALAGDLIEAYELNPSRWRLWREVLGAIAFARRGRADDIRPLRLTDLQPADAIERSRRFALRLKPVSLRASPLAGTGGLPVPLLALLMTLVMPGAWWLFGAAVLSGIALGAAMIALHRSRPPARADLELTSSGRTS